MKNPSHPTQPEGYSGAGDEAEGKARLHPGEGRAYQGNGQRREHQGQGKELPGNEGPSHENQSNETPVEVKAVAAKRKRKRTG